MSSFSALFKAAGSQECEVVTCSYNFNQSTDDKGRPSSVVQGGSVNVTIIATAESKPLISWMLDPYKQESGSITFKRADQDSMLKDIQFEEAYCVGYTEVFDGRGDGSDASMTLSLTISANKLTVNGAKLDNKWK